MVERQGACVIDAGRTLVPKLQFRNEGPQGERGGSPTSERASRRCFSSYCVAVLVLWRSMNLWHPFARVSRLSAILVLVLITSAEAAERSVDRQLERLKNADAEMRLEGLRELQTSLDPRLPEAFMPLLADEGNSVRRLAARAVGSRWWQIPRERVPVFLKALQRNEKSEFDDEVNMVRRAQGLLQRDYGANMFVRSPNGRWVIYERRNLPCVIDTKTGTEELAGWREEEEGRLYGAWGNGTLENAALWHGGGNIAAMSIGIGRRESAVWFWQQGGRVEKLGQDRMIKVLGKLPGKFMASGGFYTEIKAWKGDELQIEVTFTLEKGDDLVDQAATLGYNPIKKTLRLVSR